METGTEDTDTPGGKKQITGSKRNPYEKLEGELEAVGEISREDQLRANKIIIMDLLGKVKGRFRVDGGKEGLALYKVKLDTYRVLLYALDVNNKTLKDAELSQIEEEIQELKAVLAQKDPAGTRAGLPGRGLC